MTIEYYFQCKECNRWYEDESSESNVSGVCIHCGPVPTTVDPKSDPNSPF